MNQSIRDPFDQAAHAPMRAEGNQWKLGRGNALKIASALSLLLVLFTWFDANSIVIQLLAVDPAHAILGVLFLLLQVVVSCVRWVYILRKQNLPLDQRNMISIYGCSLIANMLFITSIAGMSVRVALLVRHGAKLTKALASVAAERIAALSGLVAAGGVGIAFMLPTVSRGAAAMPMPELVLTAVVVLTVLILALSTAWRHLSVVRTFMQELCGCFASVRMIGSVIALSAAIVFSGFCGLAMLANGMGLNIDPLFFIAVMPAIALISALPISIGGWGVRESAMVAGLAAFSVPGESAVALSVLYGLAGVMVTVLIGTVLAYSGKNGFATKEQ